MFTISTYYNIPFDSLNSDGQRFARKPTITSDPKAMSTKKYHDCIGKPGPFGSGQAQKCGRVKLLNGTFILLTAIGYQSQILQLEI